MTLENWQELLNDAYQRILRPRPWYAGPEEREYVATGSGSLHASTVVKVGFERDMTRDEAVELVARSLWEAADADSATGGPDALRGIYPVVATVTADGWERVADDELATRYQAIAAQVLARSDTDGGAS